MRFYRGLKFVVVSVLLTTSQFLLAVENINVGSTDEQSRLAAVLVTGSTQFDHDQQLEIYQYFLGQLITRELVEELRRDFQQAYIGEGILRPGVNISSHSDYADILIINLQEARVGQLDLQPGSGKLAESIREIILDRTFSKPLRQSEVVDLLQELSDIEGAVIEASFQPRSHDSYYYDLRINAKPKLQAWLELSNEGGELLGPEIAELELKYNQIFET